MMLPSSGLGLALEAVGLADAGRVGRKAATLGELKRAGFPVPEGVVLTTEALAQTLAAAGLGGDAQPEQVLAVGLPDEVAEAMAAAAERLGGGLLAVRSSGVDEDLAGASYAGQYESVLDVPAERLTEAVRRCWASAFAEHVVAYRRAHGGGAGAAMAVLVLPMVAAEAAGVAFSADPVSGDRATAVVSAVRGLGERLVGGQASPDEWVVRGGQATCRTAPEGAIDAHTAVAVAALARRVQEHFGAPQDIKWAWAAGELVLLQARPIAALPDQAPAPVPVAVQVPPGFWQREASHAPKPLSPLLLSVLSEPRNRAIRRAFTEFGALAEGLEFRDLGGWQYTRLVPLGGRDRPPPPGWLLPLLVRVVPRLRRRVRDAAAAISTDKAGQLLQSWYAQWRPQLDRRIRVLREVDLGALDDQGLDDHTAQAMALLDDGLQVHFCSTARSRSPWPSWPSPAGSCWAGPTRRPWSCWLGCRPPRPGRRTGWPNWPAWPPTAQPSLPCSAGPTEAPLIGWPRPIPSSRRRLPPTSASWPPRAAL